MASRPLPPGRRGRGSRTVSAAHLPEVKLLDVPVSDRGSVDSAPAAAETVTTPVPPSSQSDVYPPAGMKSTPDSYDVSVHEEHNVVARNEWQLPPPVSEPVESIVVDEELDSSPGNHADAPLEDTTASRTVDESATCSQAPCKSQPQVPERKKEEHDDPSPAAMPSLQVWPSYEPEIPIETVVQEQHQVFAPSADVGSFHPFQLLLPLEYVPDVPETMDCVYDDEAVEMQKNIMKVVKKLVNKNRVKLEDFKINSRLFGNNFMEPYEYIEAMAKDFGASRSLQLVPCLAAIQPDFMKRSSLLVAAKSYRLRNFDRLSKEISQSRQVQPPVPTSRAHIGRAEVHTLEEPQSISTTVRSNLSQVDAGKDTAVATVGVAMIEETTTSHLDELTEALSTPVIVPDSKPTNLSCDISNECVDSSKTEDNVTEDEHGRDITIEEPSENANCVGQEMEAAPVEPAVSSWENVDASSMANTVCENDQACSISPTSNKSVEPPLTAETTASSPTESSSLNMFGEEMSVDSDLSAPSQSAFYEAETLFGESFSWSSSKPEPFSVPAAESSSAAVPSTSVATPMSGPVVVAPPMKPTHSAFLFGMATAGASDSDSDSDFSD